MISARQVRIFGMGAAALLGLTGMQPASGPLPVASAPATTSGEPPWVVADPVTVTAPSPRLWKLTRGGSTVWVLGEVAPLPRGLGWNSAPLARVMQGADRVLLPPEGSVDLFEGLGALARSRLPGGATLAATLPPELEQRYDAVLRRLGQDPAKPRRDKPAWAALFLEVDFVRSRAVDLSEPFGTIRRIARDSHVPVGRVASYAPTDVLRELVDLPEAESEATLADAVAGVDFGLDHVGAAGRAWARGDLRTVRANISPSETPLAVFLHTSSGRRIAARAVDDVTEALRSALKTPGVTVAVLSVGGLVQQGGALDRLRAEGVEVSEPPL